MENDSASEWNTSHEAQNTSEINSFYFYQTEQFTVLWILFASIVLGNTAVLVALLLNKSRKSRMNFFIMHLALADLSVGLISVLTDIVWRATVAWYAGNAACKIIRFLQATVTYSSTYVLVALSIDRYDAITHPMNFSGSWRRARILVGSAWLLSFLFSVPIIILYEEKQVQEELQCWIEFPHQWHWQLYMTLVAVTVFVIPALIITACYTVIVFTIWSKSKLLTPGAKRARHMKNGEHVSIDDQNSRRASSRGLIPKAKIKTVKMTFVIVFVFILCWSPYIVFDLLQVFGYFSKTQTNIAVATFIQSLAPLNSAANPLIYCLFSTHICRSLRKIPPFVWVSCCWARDSRAAEHQGRSLRYTHTNTDSSSVTETLTSSSARRLNTLHSSTLNPTSTRHVQLRLPLSTNNINKNNTNKTEMTASIL